MTFYYEFYLRKPETLKLSLYSKQRIFCLEGRQGRFYYPIFANLSCCVAKKNLCLRSSQWQITEKVFFKMYQVLFNQCVLGVLLSYRRQLNIVGIGYQVSLDKKEKNSMLNFKLGYSHQVNVLVPDFANVTCPKARILVIKGINLQKINYFSFYIRSLKVPSTYKEKGIYFNGETSRLKQGKKT